VAALTQHYGSLLWGEDGKGIRSEYAPAFFGELYPSLQAVKSAFDPLSIPDFAKAPAFITDW
jgi:FAD/FMN-containing dehydrogenase